MSVLLKFIATIMVASAVSFTAWAILRPVSEWWDRYLIKWSRWMQLELEAMHYGVPRHRCRQILAYTRTVPVGSRVSRELQRVFRARLRRTRSPGAALGHRLSAHAEAQPHQRAAG